MALDMELQAIRDNNLNAGITARIAQLIDEAGEISETLPSLEYFESLPLAIGPDVFFEGLIMSVKNEVLSKQSSIFKIKKFKKTVVGQDQVLERKHQS
jgi:hypothetical protein